MDLRIIAITLLVTMLVFSDRTSAQSNFTVTVQFFRYTNPTSKIGSLPNKPCCNDIDCSGNNCTTCSVHCNNYFIFCLRRPNTNLNDIMCPYGQLQTGVLSGGDSIIFVSNTEQSNGFNIPNPFTFNNLQQRDTLQLLVMTLDDSQGDSGDDSLVERFSTDILMRRDNLLRDTFEGQFDVATIRLSYEVSCSESYYGELCDNFCEGRNDSTGHYLCNDDGNIVCLSGFTDPSTFCTCVSSSEECVQDFGGSLPASMVAGAIIGILIGMVLVTTMVILMLFWRKKGGSRKWKVFSNMCYESRTRKSSSTSDEECNPHENPTYNEEAISIQGTISTRRTLTNSHNYDYITGNQQQHVRHPDSTDNGPYSYAEAKHNGNTESGPAPYSYAENSTCKKSDVQATPYSYVDNTLIQDLVLKAVHEADAQRLRTFQNLKEQSNVGISQHYETMEDYNVGNRS